MTWQFQMKSSQKVCSGKKKRKKKKPRSAQCGWIRRTPIHDVIQSGGDKSGGAVGLACGLRTESSRRVPSSGRFERARVKFDVSFECFKKNWVQATRKKRTQSRGDDLGEAFSAHTLTLPSNKTFLPPSMFPPLPFLVSSLIFCSLCLLSSPRSAWRPFHHGGETAEDGILEAAPKASPRLQCAHVAQEAAPLNLGGQVSQRRTDGWMKWGRLQVGDGVMAH